MIQAFAPAPAIDPGRLHRELARFNAVRLRPGTPRPGWLMELADEQAMRLREHSFIEEERRAATAAAAAAPTTPDAFVAWFTALREHGPGQGDALFPWLAEHADAAAMRWFLLQEVAGEAGFDDLVALTQVRFPARAKLELARNYWDEMGRGSESGMHGGLLQRLVDHFGLRPDVETTAWPSLALGNLLVGLASDRQYAFHSLGALGVVELTAPGRVALVDAGLRRLGVPARERSYFELHAALDVKHSRAWNSEAIAPLVADDPGVARWIAEGALMRLRAGARCFAWYRAHLWRTGQPDSRIEQEGRRGGGQPDLAGQLDSRQPD
jgi:hypothetical protein